MRGWRIQDGQQRLTEEKLADHFPVSIFIFKINHFVLQPLYCKGFSERRNRRLCVRTSQNSLIPDAQVPALMLVCDALIFLLLSDDPDDLWRALGDHRATIHDVLLKRGEFAIHAKVCAVVGHRSDLRGNLRGDLRGCVHGLSVEGF